LGRDEIKIQKKFIVKKKGNLKPTWGRVKGRVPRKGGSTLHNERGNIGVMGERNNKYTTCEKGNEEARGHQRYSLLRLQGGASQR